MDQQEFEDRLADLVAEARDGGLSLDEVIDGIACQLQVLNDEQQAETDHG
jgi:hypothetical protein